MTFFFSLSLTHQWQGKSNAIFAPKSPATSAHIASICDVKEIPYIDTYRDIFTKKAASINLYPSETDLSQLLIDVVDQYQWKDLAILYEAPFYSKRIGEFLENRNDRGGNIAIQPLEVGPQADFHKALHKIKALDAQSKNIIIESSVENLEQIMTQVKFKIWNYKLKLNWLLLKTKLSMRLIYII